MMDFLAWLVALPLSLSLAYLGIELLFGLRPLADRVAPASRDIRVAVLIPAHDEGLGIAETVHSLAHTAAGARILVVADNCRDDTASAARAAGAVAIERHEPERRGKGYALAFGREQLALDPPDVVIVFDADCRLQEGSADRLAARAISSGRPVQATYLLTAPASAPPIVALSNFAMLVKNLVRARGLMRLGGGAMLFGTGMAFAWPLFVRLPLATGDPVEDLNLGLHLAQQGVCVDLDDRALVTSKAAALKNSIAQRSRWEHGFLRTAASTGLPLIIRGLAARSPNLATLGAHLLIPPLALLMLLSALGLGMIGVACLVTGSWVAFALTASTFGFACLMLLAAWWHHGRATLPFASLVRIPLYILWKIPIYIGFFTRNQKEWNRTARDGEGD